MSDKDLKDLGFASQAEVDGFMARVEAELMALDPTEEFTCTCQDCEAQRVA